MKRREQMQYMKANSTVIAADSNDDSDSGDVGATTETRRRTAPDVDDSVVPRPRIAVLLCEHLCDGAAVVACARRRLVYLTRVRGTVRLGVAVARVPVPAAVRVVPPGLHEAVFLAKVRVWAVARPYCVEHRVSARTC